MWNHSHRIIRESGHFFFWYYRYCNITFVIFIIFLSNITSIIFILFISGLVRFILIHCAHTQLGLPPAGITSGLFHIKVNYLSLVSCLSISSFSATSSDYVFLIRASNKALPKNRFTFKANYPPNLLLVLILKPISVGMVWQVCL